MFGEELAPGDESRGRQEGRGEERRGEGGQRPALPEGLGPGGRGQQQDGLEPGCGVERACDQQEWRAVVSDQQRLRPEEEPQRPPVDRGRGQQMGQEASAVEDPGAAGDMPQDDQAAGQRQAQPGGGQPAHAPAPDLSFIKVVKPAGQRQRDGVLLRVEREKPAQRRQRQPAPGRPPSKFDVGGQAAQVEDSEQKIPAPGDIGDAFRLQRMRGEERRRQQRPPLVGQQAARRLPSQQAGQQMQEDVG